MKLLGDWNWYLPRWLEWLPHVTREVPSEPAAPSLPELKPDPAFPPAAGGRWGRGRLLALRV